MLPGDGKLILYERISPFIEPDNLFGFPALVDYERGGVALYDLSSGMNVQNWRSFWDRDTGFVTLESDSGEYREVFRLQNPTQLVFCFDLSMTPYFAYTETGETWIVSFRKDGETTRVLIPGATQPRLTLDRRRVQDAAEADVTLFYLKGGDLKVRYQRERFATGHVKVPDVGGTRLGRAGISTGRRLQIEVLP